MKTYVSRIQLDSLGLIPRGRAASFYRVEKWNGGFVADFTLKSEAAHFAIADARATGCRYDHKVSLVILKGA